MTDTHTHTDQELFVLVADGNEAAFGVLFHRYVPRLIPLALKITEDREVAREIVQETFLRIWLGRDRLASIDNPTGWIFTIASNQCYKHLRRKVLREELRFAGSLETELELEDTIGLHELSGLVREAVDGLSEQRRKVYLLSREGGLTIPQIAEALGLSPHTVKNTLVSALKAIRTYLAGHGYELPLVLLCWIA